MFTQTLSVLDGLLGDLGDLEGSGLLGLVRVVRPGVDLQLLQNLTAELVLGQHAPHGLLDGLAGVLLEDLADRGGREAARVTGVAVGELGRLLGAGQGDLLRVDDDDEVTSVHVRGEDRLVLAAQKVGGLDGEPAQDDVGGVDDVPLALDVSGLGAIRAHGGTSFVRDGPRGPFVPRVVEPRLLTNTARSFSGSAPRSRGRARSAAGGATDKSTGRLGAGSKARERRSAVGPPLGLVSHPDPGPT